MPAPLEHVLIVEEGSYQTLIIDLYSQWMIDLHTDKKHEINLLGHIADAVQSTVYIVQEKIDNWDTCYHILYTSELDYAMGLLVGAGN